MSLLNKIRIFFGHWPKFNVSQARKAEILYALHHPEIGGIIDLSGDEFDWLVFTKNGILQMPVQEDK